MADLPNKIKLTVVTRDRKIVDVDVDEVVLPATDGELGVLPGHTPLLATLRIGPLRYRTGGKIERLVISWGFAEVLPDRVIVLAEREIADLSSHDEGFALAEARLEESIAMINVGREG